MTKVITIDGPAASGKSSVSRDLAKRIGWTWVSTGSFYRGLAYVAKQMQVDFADEQALADLARQTDLWSVQLSTEKTKVIFRGEDVTAEAHSDAVGQLASQVSQYPEVRTALLEGQRACAKGQPGLIAEGRDCGSVVFPQANVKIFLTAKQGDRAKRRAEQMGTDAAEIELSQKQRDDRDQSRKVAPMQVPEKAHIIDTSELSLAAVVDRVEEIARASLEL